MALFRNLIRLQQLTKVSSTRPSLLFLTPVENAALRGPHQTLWRGIMTVPRYQQLKLACFSIACQNSTVAGPLLVPTSRRRLHTQTGGLLAADGEETKKPKAAPKKRQTGEHGSVLNELMSVKAEGQPKELTVGAKGVQSVRLKVTSLHKASPPSSSSPPLPHSLPSSPFQLYRPAEISPTCWWSSVASRWPASSSGQ